MSADSPEQAAPLTPAEKVKAFPAAPGVYLMKDAAGSVIYIGKAKNLRIGPASYFTKAAAEEHRTAELVKHIADIDFIPTDSEVDALLMEARLVKDIQPRFNHDLKDDKTFPYLQIRMREEFPRVEFTRTPRRQGRQAVRPVHQRPQPAHGDAGAAAHLPVPHLPARHSSRRRPLALVSARACCTASASARPRATSA